MKLPDCDVWGLAIPWQHYRHGNLTYNSENYSVCLFVCTTAHVQIR